MKLSSSTTEFGVFGALDGWEPAIAAAGVMLVLVGLLAAWETLVHQLRAKTPERLLPIVESILGEIGGLGFIGLMLEVWRPDNHELLETFEFFHSFFFQVAIAYFLFSGLLISFVVFQLDQLRNLTQLPVTNGLSTEASMASTRQLQEDGTRSVDNNDNIYWRELTLDTPKRVNNFSMKRQYLLNRYGVEEDFIVDMEPVCASYLKKLVHLNPMRAWLPLVPILAATQAVDLFRSSVFDSASENVAQIAVYALVMLWQVALLGVSIFNFVQLAQFKEDQKQFLLGNSNATHENENTVLSEEEQSSDDIPTVPIWYLSSIQYHAWFTVTGIVFFVTEALLQGFDPELVGLEFAGLALLTVSSILQLWLTPSVFWNYCLVNVGQDKFSAAIVEEQVASYRSSKGIGVTEEEGGKIRSF